MAKEVFFYSSSDDIPHLGGKRLGDTFKDIFVMHDGIQL